MQIQDITGQSFGRWTVLKFHDKAIYKYAKGGSTVPRWLCRCACGKEKIVRGNTLKNESSVSCGCHKTELQIARQFKHGMTKTPEYAAWAHMMDRCGNPKNVEYHNYGARGITVCDRWKTAANFLSDMGKRPSANHSLERENNELGYSPDNCVWATMPEQTNNKRTNRRLRFRGKVQTISQWATELGISQTNIWNRLIDGWSTEDTLTIPVDTDKTGWNVRRLRQRS